MGKTLSKFSSPYGLVGVKLSSENDLKDVVIGFIQTDHQVRYYDGERAQNVDQQRSFYLPTGCYIRKLTIREKSKISDVYGTLIIEATDGSSTQFPIQVHCATNSFALSNRLLLENLSDTSSNVYECTTGDPPSERHILGGFELNCDTDSNTRISSISFVCIPESKQITFERAGIIGTVKDRMEGLIGFVEDGGKSVLFDSETEVSNASIQTEYFDHGYVLTELSVSRVLDQTGHKGVALITMVAQNSRGKIQKYETYQAYVQPITNSFMFCSDANRSIKSLCVLSTKGVTHRRDFLIVKAESHRLIAPKAKSYPIAAKLFMENHWGTIKLIFFILLLVIIARWITKKRENSSSIKKKE